MAEALHHEVEELKGVLDAGFVFMEASKVCMCMCRWVGGCRCGWAWMCACACARHNAPLRSFRITYNTLNLHKFICLTNLNLLARNWSRERHMP